jgi:tetratricopeptide (TPR) repeat protein
MQTAELSAEIARLRRELELDPRSLRFVQLADLLRKDGRPEEALAVLEKGLSRHPQHRTALLVRARSLADLGDTAQALVILSELHPKDRGNLSVCELFVELLLAEDRLEEARQVVEDADLLGAGSAWRARMDALIDEAQLPQELEPALSLPGAFVELVGETPMEQPVSQKSNALDLRVFEGTAPRRRARTNPAFYRTLRRLQRVLERA